MGTEPLDKLSTNKKSNTFFWLLLIVFLGGVIFAVTRLYELEKPHISITSNLSLIGSSGSIGVQIFDEKSGIQSYSITLKQEKKVVKLADKKFTKKSFLAGGPRKVQESIDIDAGLLGITDGRADLYITAKDFSFWKWMAGNETTEFYPVAFDVKPPRIRLVDSPASIKPGSSGIVIYRADEDIFDHGVTINDDFHRGFPVPGRSTGTYGAMIGIQYDSESIHKASITASDKAGNKGVVSFALNLRKVKKSTDRINVGDNFLNKKVPEFNQYYPEMSGEMIDQYIYVNNEIRKQNAQKIREICSKSSSDRYWSGKFGRMRRSSRRAGFADYRSYYYNGSKVDEQVHLGIDLASVRQADVEASNRGKVVFADYLGIYGNMVVLDHGMGIFSLYSHMSEISVTSGEMVEKGAALGRTGTTGMAGGDHLHFSILVNGVFVNPVEWWDKGWVDLHINQYLKG